MTKIVTLDKRSFKDTVAEARGKGRATLPYDRGFRAGLDFAFEAFLVCVAEQAKREADEAKNGL